MNHALALLCVAWAVPEPDPPLEDCLRFPCEWVCDENLAFADRHREWIEGRRLLEPLEWEWREAFYEADGLSEAWNILAFAQAKGLPERSRRDSLRRLREHIGREAYDRALMPPPVPLWRFRRFP